MYLKREGGGKVGKRDEISVEKRISSTELFARSSVCTREIEGDWYEQCLSGFERDIGVDLEEEERESRKSDSVISLRLENARRARENTPRD